MTDTHLNWLKFDADNADPAAEELIRNLQAKLLEIVGVDKSNTLAVRKFASEQVALYKEGKNLILNKACMVHIFRPSEFDSIEDNDASLSKLQQFLLYNQFNWNEGSKRVQQALNRMFDKVGSVRMEGGREYVELDNLISVEGKTVAIEIETSINLDNGYYTLRQAIRNKKADYGIMIVPWTAEGPGRTDEAKALERLDREFDRVKDMRDGPIYRIAIVRVIDLFQLLLSYGNPK